MQKVDAAAVISNLALNSIRATIKKLEDTSLFPGPIVTSKWPPSLPVACFAAMQTKESGV
jgi:hypothetical protein